MNEQFDKARQRYEEHMRREGEKRAQQGRGFSDRDRASAFEEFVRSQ